MALRQADRLESNNPKAYGIVRAIEVSGHKTVSSLENLYTIADCILSDSKKNTNNDALGQCWYVVSEGISYQLVNWEGRSTAMGWKRLETDLSSYVTTDQLKAETDKKQNKLVPGNGIIIDEETNTISCELDADLFRIVEELPEASAETSNKIYLKLSVAQGSDDKYVEYITVVNDGVYSWEKLGEYSASIDLSDYLKSSDAESLYLKLTDAESIYATKDEISDMETQSHAASTYQTITKAEEDHKAITDRLDSFVSDQGANSTLDGYTESTESGDSLKVIESDTIKEGIGKLSKAISDNKIAASEEVSSLSLKVTANESAITELQGSNSDFETRISASELTLSEQATTIADNTSAITSLSENKASKDIVTTSNDGLMSSADKVKFDGIFAGNLALPTPSLSGTWSYFNLAGEAVTITPGSGNKIEKGYQAQWVGTYSWTHEDGKKDPTKVQSGSNWSDLPASGVASESYDTGKVSTNTTIKIGIQAAKTGLMVVGSDVKPASGFDTTSASASVTFLDRLYYGVCAKPSSGVEEADIKALSDTELIASKSKTISGITCDETQYYVFAYPTSLGELSTIIQDGATPVLGAFTQSTINITNEAGKSVSLYVYVSNNPGAFTNSKLAFS